MESYKEMDARHAGERADCKGSMPELIARQTRELYTAINDRTDGSAFAEDMFTGLMADHEFGVDLSLERILFETGFSLCGIRENANMLRGLRAAMADYPGAAEMYAGSLAPPAKEAGALGRWRAACREAECRAYEALDNDKARKELSAGEIRQLIYEAGEDDRAWCDDEGRIFRHSDRALAYVPTRGLMFFFDSSGEGAVGYSVMEYDWKGSDPAGSLYPASRQEYPAKPHAGWRELIPEIVRSELGLTRYDYIPVVILDDGE